MKKYFFLFLYYTIFRHLPHSTIPIVGSINEYLRYQVCRRIFKKCGKKVNIGSKARFGNGFNIEIGDYSGIGINARVPSNIIIGSYVMMAPNVTIINSNHVYDSIVIPMMMQGYKTYKPIVIDDDVWIGNNVIILQEERLTREVLSLQDQFLQRIFLNTA